MISFRRKAEWLGAGRIVAPYDGVITADELSAILDPSDWTLERFDEVSSLWKVAEDAETLSAIYPDISAGRLELRFSGLDGLYRLKLSVSSQSVKSGCDFFYFREARSSREPYHLYLEGWGEIDYIYLHQDGLPQGISQKLDLKEGIATCGGLSFTLVDYDGRLSEIFAPRNSKVVAVLDNAIAATDMQATLTGGDDLPSSGLLWLDRELIEYSAYNNDTLTISRRGALRTRATQHAAGTHIRDIAPYIKGRALYIEKADGSRLYGGVINRVSPHSDNQVCYRVELTDALSALDIDIGCNLGRADIAPLYLIHGGAARFRLRWVDALALGGYKPSEAGTLVRLRPGIYDITPGRSGAGHICNEIERAIKDSDDICNERFVSAVINEDGQLQIRLKGSYRVDLLPTESACVLTQLGFPEDGLSYVDDEAWTDSGSRPEGLFTLLAGAALADSYVSATSDVILIEANSDERSLNASGGLMRIGDELAAYGGILQLQHGRTGLLASDMDGSISADTLKLEDANGFFGGQLVLIDDEQIMLGEKWGDSFNECVRGAGGSAIAAHYAGAQVILADVEMIYAVKRGIYGSSAEAHGSGDGIEELLCSDDLSDTQNPQATNPVEFIAALLGCADDSHLSRFSLGLPTEMLDTDGITNAVTVNCHADASSFLAIIGSGTSYRDALANVALCLGAGLYVDSQARISLGAFEAHLEHEEQQHVIAAGDWIGPPTLTWCEDGRINRVAVLLDRDPVADEHARKIVLNDTVEDTLELFRSSEHSFELKADYFHSCESKCRSGAADTMFIGLARRCFTWFNRFYTAVEGRLPLAAHAGLGLFDSVTLSLPNVACGDGTRGIDKVVFDVVEIEPDLCDMSLRVVLIERGDARYGGLNIAADIFGYQADEKILALACSEYWPYGMEPGQLLKSGDRVRIKRRSQGGSLYSQTLEIAAVEQTWRYLGGLYCAEVTLAQTPDLTPQMGDLLVAAPYTAHTSTDSVIRHLLHLSDNQGALGNDEAFVYSY